MHKLGLIDDVIPEPLGGAHRDPEATAEVVRNAIVSALAELEPLSRETLVAERRQKLLAYGLYKEA